MSSIILGVMILLCYAAINKKLDDIEDKVIDLEDKTNEDQDNHNHD